MALILTCKYANIRTHFFFFSFFLGGGGGGGGGGGLVCMISFVKTACNFLEIFRNLFKLQWRSFCYTCLSKVCLVFFFFSSSFSVHFLFNFIKHTRFFDGCPTALRWAAMGAVLMFR